MSDIADWFKRLPFFTRWWLSLTAGFTLCGRFGIFKAYQLVLLYEPFIKQFQVRPYVQLRLMRYHYLKHVKFIINGTTM
jgi:derlin-1